MVSSLRIPSLLLIALFVSTSCGRTKQRVDVQENSTMRSTGAGPATIKDPNCTKASCPAAEFSIVDDAGRDLSSASLEGAVDVGVNWKLRVKSSSPQGRVRIAVTEALLWMQKDAAAEPGGIDITGTPTEPVSSSFLVVLARDMTRCAILEKSSKSCGDVSLAMPDYDRTIKIKFSISGQ